MALWTYTASFASKSIPFGAVWYTLVIAGVRRLWIHRRFQIHGTPNIANIWRLFFLMIYRRWTPGSWNPWWSSCWQPVCSTNASDISNKSIDGGTHPFESEHKLLQTRSGPWCWHVNQRRDQFRIEGDAILADDATGPLALVQKQLAPIRVALDAESV